MVDSTKGIGSTPGINNANKPQAAEARRAERLEESRKADEVSISREAEEKQAKEQARAARIALEKSDESLGLDPEFDQAV